MKLYDFEWKVKRTQDPVLICSNCECHIAWSSHCFMKKEDTYYIDSLHVLNSEEWGDILYCRCDKDIGSIDGNVVTLINVLTTRDSKLTFWNLIQ